jgi:hypothetical protein
LQIEIPKLKIVGIYRAIQKGRFVRKAEVMLAVVSIAKR